MPLPVKEGAVIQQKDEHRPSGEAAGPAQHCRNPALVKGSSYPAVGGRPFLIMRHYGTVSLGAGAANKQRPERRPLGSSTRCELDSRKPRPPRSSETTVEAPTEIEAAVGATVEAPIEMTAATPPVQAPVYFAPLQIGFCDGRGSA